MYLADSYSSCFHLGSCMASAGTSGASGHKNRDIHQGGDSYQEIRFQEMDEYRNN